MPRCCEWGRLAEGTALRSGPPGAGRYLLTRPLSTQVERRPGDFRKATVGQVPRRVSDNAFRVRLPARPESVGQGPRQRVTVTKPSPVTGQTEAPKRDRKVLPLWGPVAR